MIFHMHGQTLLRRIQARVFGNCPALERTVQFQPKVIMQPQLAVCLPDNRHAIALIIFHISLDKKHILIL